MKGVWTAAAAFFEMRHNFPKPFELGVEHLANVVLVAAPLVLLAGGRVSLGREKQALIREAELHEAPFVRLVVWVIQQDNPVRKGQLSRMRARASTHHLGKPSRSREVWLLHNVALTEDVAQQFARLAMRLQSRGHGPQEVAHFVNRLVFCMFAEDVDLLPNGLFKRKRGLVAALRA